MIKIIILIIMSITAMTATTAYSLDPIAHTDVVPYQRIEYGTSFNFGVVAFSKAGIDRVDFAISGQGYSGGTKTSSTMALNTRVSTTSPGAEYDGVWEYYVTISASEFTSNGIITVTPTVYGDDYDAGVTGYRVLDAITLYVEGASNESPTEAWVDIDSSDGTGTLDDDTDPYPSITSALTAIESANGDCDYSIVYLAEDSYGAMSSTVTTNNEWVTITKEASADISNVIMTGLLNISTSHLKIKNVTFQAQAANNTELLRLDGSWVDHCRIIGFGRLAGDESNPVDIDYGYLIGNYVYDTMNGVMDHHNHIIRGYKIEHISNDAIQNTLFAVNIQVNDIDPSDTYPCPRYNNGDICHADSFQSYQDGGTTYDNRILYNYIATDANYQGVFMRQENALASSNVALVNVFIELRSWLGEGGGFNGIYGDWDHVLIWNNTYVATGEPDHWGFGTFLFDDEPTAGFDLTNVSIIGNVFHGVLWSTDESIDTFANGNSDNNVVSYNHFEISGAVSGQATRVVVDSNSPTTYTTGDDAVDISTPGSATFGYPYSDHVIVDGLPSNLTGIPADAYGNLRDSTPDIGALEYDSGPTHHSLGTGIHIQ